MANEMTEENTYNAVTLLLRYFIYFYYFLISFNYFTSRSNKQKFNPLSHYKAYMYLSNIKSFLFSYEVLKCHLYLTSYTSSYCNLAYYRSRSPVNFNKFQLQLSYTCNILVLLYNDLKILSAITRL